MNKIIYRHVSRWLGAAVCAVSCASGGTALGQEINPYPRQVLRKESLHQWEFQGGTAGWTALHDCTIAATGGTLRIQSVGTDPYLISGPFSFAGPLAVQIRVKCAAGGAGEFFWTTVEASHTDAARSQHFKLVHDGQWHNYFVRIEEHGTLTHLRFDPGTAPGWIEVEKIELIRETVHPLELQSIHAEGRQITVALTNHAAEAVACRVENRPITVAGHTAQQVTFTVAGKAPFATQDVTVRAEKLPPLCRTAFIADAEAEGDWVTLKSPELTLRAARAPGLA